MKKFLSIFLSILVIALIGFVYWRFYFVFAEGTKAGQLNTFQKKGSSLRPMKARLFRAVLKPVWRAIILNSVCPKNQWRKYCFTTQAKKWNCIIKDISEAFPGAARRAISWTLFMRFKVCLLLLRRSMQNNLDCYPACIKKMPSRLWISGVC